MAISSPSKTIPIIRQIQKRTISLLRQSINIQFHWVPGHRNIHGNELADKAAVNNPIYTTHNIKIPLSHCKPLLKDYFQTLWNTEWAQVESDNITKSFFTSPASARVFLKSYNEKFAPEKGSQLAQRREIYVNFTSQWRKMGHRENSSKN